MRMIKLGILLTFMFALTLGCKSRGAIHVTAVPVKPKGTIAIAYLEYRDIRQSSTLTRDFRDALSTELFKKGYKVVIVDAMGYRQRQADRRSREIFEKSRKKSKKKRKGRAKSDDMLPRGMKHVAGETRPLTHSNFSPDKLYFRPHEIKKLADRRKYNYFIQGAISRTEPGTLLDSEENYALYLGIFSPKGDKIGVVDFTVTGNSLMDPGYRKAVCARIANGFIEQIALGKRTEKLY